LPSDIGQGRLRGHKAILGIPVTAAAVLLLLKAFTELERLAAAPDPDSIGTAMPPADGAWPHSQQLTNGVPGTPRNSRNSGK